MIANWIHVMVVHVVVIGVPWLLYRVVVHRKVSMDSASWKANYSILILLGLLATVSYFTGPKAADWTKLVLDPYPQDLVENHALWGRIAFILQGIAALIGFMGWMSIWQEEQPDKRITILVLILLAANTFVLVYTAHLGGLIRRLDFL
ncbi:MAG: hypothetical protein AAFV80_21650 [Bacteroidota bacterium]